MGIDSDPGDILFLFDGLDQL